MGYTITLFSPLPGSRHDMFQFSREMFLLSQSCKLSEEMKRIPKDMTNVIDAIHDLHNELFPRLQEIVLNWWGSILHPKNKSYLEIVYFLWYLLSRSGLSPNQYFPIFVLLTLNQWAVSWALVIKTKWYIMIMLRNNFFQ